jgi:hypothetical protein
VSDYGMVVYYRIIGMVRGVGVLSSGGVVVMGTVRATTLHTRELGKPEFPLPLQVVSSSSVDSSRIVCSDGNLL